VTSAPRYKFGARAADGSIRGIDNHLSRPVIIKPWWTGGDCERLKSTLVRLGSLQCKHVADGYDLLQMDDGVLAVVEEYVGDLTLAEWESKPGRSESEVLSVLLQVTAALAALHSDGISPHSLADVHWRFDDEGILNLSPFGPRAAFGGPGEPTSATPESKAADLLALAQLAKRLGAAQPVALGGSTLNDPILKPLWSGATVASHTATAIRNRLNALLVRDQHRAVVVFRGQSGELNAARPTLRLAHPNPTIGEVLIQYDGIEFSIPKAVGETYLNNTAIVAPSTIPGSCVITLGSPDRSWNERVLVTFDASHPEVLF
jgi:eukaryotic-like serine/threonine-protein kinase